MLLTIFTSYVLSAVIGPANTQYVNQFILVVFCIITCFFYFWTLIVISSTLNDNKIDPNHSVMKTFIFVLILYSSSQLCSALFNIIVQDTKNSHLEIDICVDYFTLISYPLPYFTLLYFFLLEFIVFYFTLRSLTLFNFHTFN